MSKEKPVALPPNDVFARFVTRYHELSETCYRVAISKHDKLGRFQKGHAGKRPPQVLLKKIDLDRDLLRMYQKFFDPQPEGTGPVSTSISKSRRQGSEIRTDSAFLESETWEA